MMRTSLSLALGLALVGLVACGDDGGGTNNPGIDAAEFLDARVDAPPAPMMLTITGTATERTASGSMPVADALIEGYRNSDETTPIAMTMSDAEGNFTLTVETGGEGIDGFIKATKTDLIVTYLYPADPIVADTSMVPVIMVTPGTYDAVSTLAGGDQIETNGLIAANVVDGALTTSMPVAGATVSSTPEATAYRYNGGALGLPNPDATVTHTDGIGYMFNLPPDAKVTVSAAKDGMTFRSHDVKAWAGALTTTLITP